MPVLEYDIQDNAANATRFLVLGPKSAEPTGRDRTTLLAMAQDGPGALLLHDMRQFMRDQPPSHSRVGRILSCAKDHRAPDSECAGVDRFGRLLGLSPGVHTHAAEIVPEL